CDQALSADEAGEVALWDVASGQTLRRWRAHRGAGEAITFSPNGRFAATAGADGRTRLGNLGPGGDHDAFEARWKHRATAGAVGPDGKLVAAGSAKGRVGIWSVKTGEPVHLFRVKGPVDAIGFNDALNLMLIGSTEGAAVWKFRLPGGDSAGAYALSDTVNFRRMVALPDGRRVATIGMGPPPVVGRRERGGDVNPALMLAGPVGGLVLNAAANFARKAKDATADALVAGEAPSGWVLQLWNVVDDRLVHSFPCTPAPECLAVAPGGARAITAAADGKLRVWGCCRGLRRFDVFL